MKLDLEKVSEHGSFSIEATEGREIIATFIDFETALLIVEEVAEPPGPSRSIYVTTIDPAAARIVSPAERRIDYSEKTETDPDTGWKRVFRRELDADTGNEFIHEELYESDIRTSTSRRVAFSATRMPTIFDSKRAWLKEEVRREAFWKTEYAAKSFEERVAYWSGQIHRHMRWQTESGLDPFAGFTPAWYEEARSRDPDFDRILDAVRAPAEVLRRIGKAATLER